MCLIVLKRQGCIVSKEALQEGFKSNADGAGMAWVDGEEMITDKGWFNFDEFYKAYLELGDREVLIHFRNASAGMVVNAENCHPFAFDSGKVWEYGEGDDQRPAYEFAVVHNGKLDFPNTKDKSDTHCFVEEILAPQMIRDPFFLDDPAGVFLLTRATGGINKLVVMRYDVDAKASKVYIINPKGGTGEKEAHEKGGCWFSNSSYLKVVHPYHHDWYREYGGDEAPKEDYNTPDADGWYWSYKRDMWINKSGDLMALHPKARLRPPYMSGQVAAIVLPVDDDNTLSHLEPIDRKRMRRMACDYAKDNLGQASGLSSDDALFLFRSDVRKAFDEECSKKSAVDLDKWIIEMDWSTNEDWLLNKQLEQLELERASSKK